MYKAVTNETRLHIDEAIVKVSLLIQSHWTTSAVFWLHSLEVPWDGGKKECIFAFFFFFFSFQVTTLLRDSGVLCSNRPVWSMNDLTAALKQKCRQKNICRKIRRNLRRGCFFVGYTVTTSWHSQTIINLFLFLCCQLLTCSPQVFTNYSLYFPFVFLSVAVMQCVFVCVCVLLSDRGVSATLPRTENGGSVDAFSTQHSRLRCTWWFSSQRNLWAPPSSLQSRILTWTPRKHLQQTTQI